MKNVWLANRLGVKCRTYTTRPSIRKWIRTLDDGILERAACTAPVARGETMNNGPDLSLRPPYGLHFTLSANPWLGALHARRYSGQLDLIVPYSGTANMSDRFDGLTLMTSTCSLQERKVYILVGT